MKNLVLTEQSILKVANTINKSIIENGEFPNSDIYYKISILNDTDVILTGNSKDSHIEKLPLILIDKIFFDVLDNDIELVSDALLQIHSLVVRYNQNKNLLGYIPAKVYCKDNQIVLSVKNYHIFVLVNTNNTGTFFVFKATTDKKESIEKAQPNMDFFNTIQNSRKEIRNILNEKITEKKILDESNINFDFYYTNNQQQSFTYENWLNRLSSLQKAFLNKPAVRAIKLRGPAGTGKTLAMELKAIKLIRENPNAKILYTCHSWAVAFQVSDFISSLDYDAGLKIDAIPILALADSKVPKEGLDSITLGDDSFSGKIEQIKLLNSIILEYKNSDWKILERKCSKEFKEQFNNISSENNNFTWDIMIEISSIIMANGFMPINSDRDKYLNFERRDWMLPLKNENDKIVIFDIYKKLLQKLDSENKVTTDQVINDYINILTTFIWFRARKQEGYDYIFVDEMQLFNAQEKAVLQYLTRNPETYPVLIMAMDPKQAIDEVYSSYGITDVFNGMDPEIEKEMGNPEDVCLTEAFRYSSEILKFLKHIDSCYPVYDFGKDWNNNIKKTSSNQASGPLPKITYYNSSKEEVTHSIIKAKELSGNFRVAILCLQDDCFQLLKETVNNEKDFMIIESMNVSHTLKYSKRNVFVSKPNYVIGLQFDAVILLGCDSKFKEQSPYQSCYKRRFLSDMYLGASRAKSILLLYSNRNAPSIPDVIKTAIEKKFIEEKL